MANDREVLREIWDGKVPVCFTLNSEEICDLQGPDPFYLMVPRLSYFPLCTEKVRKHFIRHIQSDTKQEHEMWLEFNGIPLKWHYPIGVLLDIYFNDIQLPWNIVVHFDKFPENILMHCQNKEVVEAYFLSCIKEADVLKHRGQIVSSMQKKDHTQLWNGIMNDKFDQFWSVNGRLMEASSEEGFKYIPFRCYTSEDKYVQKLVKPINEEGQRKTLKHLLNEVFPDQENGLYIIRVLSSWLSLCPRYWKLDQDLEQRELSNHIRITSLRRCWICLFYRHFHSDYLFFRKY